ncbi:MAG: NAD-dependent deacylase [Magnetospirillum sp.]|nr:NAD-dependent deacylase [Magnetospirillum sp.]
MEFAEDLLSALREAERVVVFTGAGVSAESGIPTFRDALTGLWEQYKAEELATEEAFLREPDLVWGWYEWRRLRVMRANPNPAHRAIVALARRIPKMTLVTQNVDDLHERAGSADVIHVHGSLFHPRCHACGQPFALGDEPPVEAEGARWLAPPRCRQCGGPVRPGVVWFGELLPEDQWDRATEATENCSLFLCVGTSSLVYPAAQLPHTAAYRQATVVQVNPHPTALDKVVRHNVVGLAGEAMPQLLAAAWPED